MRMLVNCWVLICCYEMVLSLHGSLEGEDGEFHGSGAEDASVVSSIAKGRCPA